MRKAKLSPEERQLRRKETQARYYKNHKSEIQLRRAARRAERMENPEYRRMMTIYYQQRNQDPAYQSYQKNYQKSYRSKNYKAYLAYQKDYREKNKLMRR